MDTAEISASVVDDSRQRSAAVDQSTLAWLDKHHIGYRLDRIALDAIDDIASRSVQAREGEVPEAVQRYTTLLEQGTVFPTIVVRPIGKGNKLRYVVHDGYHRYRSHFARWENTGRSAYFAHIPAIIIDRNTEPAWCQLLATVANSSHGVQVAADWQISQALQLGRSRGLSMEVVAAELSLPLDTLILSENAARANQRGAQLMGNDWWKLRLSKEDKERINSLVEDDVFRSALKAVECKAVTGSDRIERMVNQINAQASAEERLAVADDYRCGVNPRNRTRSTGGTSTAQTRLRSAMRAMSALTLEDVKFLLSEADQPDAVTNQLRDLMLHARRLEQGMVTWRNQHTPVT